MGRGYKRKRDPLDPGILVCAMEDLKRKVSLREVSRSYGIPRTTLLGLRRRLENGDTSIPNAGRKTVFSYEQEKALEEFLLKSSDCFFGLSREECQEMAFQFAKLLNIQVPLAWMKKQAAGKEWYLAFVKRHPALSERKAEATSLARATSFNKHNVEKFYDQLEEAALQVSFHPDNIWNCDETGVYTSHVPKKVISRCGRKQIGQITSGERGELVTVTLAVSASGKSIPPFFIFPRAKFKQDFLKGSPKNSIGSATKSGWMNAENFLNFMKHFRDYSGCSLENPVLLLLDNHESHRSLEVILFCRDNGIVLLSFPPHCSHRMQPLDVSVYGPFKSAYNKFSASWQRMNPRRMVIGDVPEIVGKSLAVSASVSNITAGFKATGIYPYNRNIFTEIDFSPSGVTDRPFEPNESVSTTSPQGNSPEERNAPLTEASMSNVEPNDLVPAEDAPEEYVGVQANVSSYSAPTTDDDKSLLSMQIIENLRLLEQMRPYPKAAPRKTTRGRKPGKSSILTNDNSFNEILLAQTKKILAQANHSNNPNVKFDQKESLEEEPLQAHKRRKVKVEIVDANDNDEQNQSHENPPKSQKRRNIKAPRKTANIDQKESLEEEPLKSRSRKRFRI